MASCDDSNEMLNPVFIRKQTNKNTHLSNADALAVEQYVM